MDTVLVIEGYGPIRDFLGELCVSRGLTAHLCTTPGDARLLMGFGFCYRYVITCGHPGEPLARFYPDLAHVLKPGGCIVLFTGLNDGTLLDAAMRADVSRGRLRVIGKDSNGVEGLRAVLKHVMPTA